VEVAGVLNDPHGQDPDSFQGGRFSENVGAAGFHRAKAAPGEPVDTAALKQRLASLRQKNELPALGMALTAK
jgi:hypothetical protein